METGYKNLGLHKKEAISYLLYIPCQEGVHLTPETELRWINRSQDLTAGAHNSLSQGTTSKFDHLTFAEEH